MNPFENKHGVSFGWHGGPTITESGGAISYKIKPIETDLHSYRDFGLYPVENEIIIDAPQVATSGIYVPGMDGELDTTESLDGIVHYKNRKASFKFKAIDAKNTYVNTYHTLLRLIHGRTASVVLDDDPRGYYVGRWSVSKPELDNKMGVAYFTIVGDCRPYQYDYISTGLPWLWNNFLFTKDSLRRNYVEIKITATENRDFTVIPSELPVVPNITVTSASVGVTGVNVTYTPIYGKNEKTQLILCNTPDNRGIISDLILCSLRDESVKLKFELAGDVNSDSFATINIDYETGRL